MQKGVIKLLYIPSLENTTDIFTKLISERKLSDFLSLNDLSLWGSVKINIKSWPYSEWGDNPYKSPC